MLVQSQSVVWLLPGPRLGQAGSGKSGSMIAQVGRHNDTFTAQNIGCWEDEQVKEGIPSACTWPVSL